MCREIENRIMLKQIHGASGLTFIKCVIQVYNHFKFWAMLWASLVDPDDKQKRRCSIKQKRL